MDIKKRIGYTKVGKSGSALMSKSIYLTDDKLVVRVMIDVYNLTAKLLNVGKHDEVIDTLVANGLPQLKLKVKKKLKSMGVRFFDEVRLNKQTRNVLRKK